MKKLIVIITCITLLTAVLVGCTGGNSNNSAVTPVKNIPGELSDIVKKIYDNLDDSVQIPPVMNEELTKEGTRFNTSIEYFIGSKDIPFKEGLVSEAAIGAHAYSLVLLRMEPNADIEAAKKTIKDNVDPRKWICVGVDPGDVIVDNIGDLLILIMSESSKELHEAFMKLAD